ncbi:hypothetical protein TNCV_3691571 [Trichonephila clavipes]|nr:hypothetical protein TNCV_3691571 [Trichonephila clavipes]
MYGKSVELKVILLAWCDSLEREIPVYLSFSGLDRGLQLRGSSPIACRCIGDMDHYVFIPLQFRKKNITLLSSQISPANHSLAL